MITINTVSASKFSYNGINYFKNFTPFVTGNKIAILNTYDACISLTSAPTHFSEYLVNGQTFASVALLQDALLPIIFTKSGLFTTQWGEIGGSISAQSDLQNVLNAKADLVSGKVPANQLPSFVDDVLEFANLAAFPSTGETGKIYIALDNNKVYRWSGTAYIEVAANSGVWGGITGTLSNQTDLQSALNAKEDDIAAGTTAQYWRGDKTWQTLDKTTVGLGSVDNTTDLNKPISTATQTALDLKANTSQLHNEVTIGTANGLSLSGQTLSLGLASSSTNGALSSTDWNTFNNKQNTLTNPVTGTGTTNTLSKFIGANSLGNSNITDTGTVVSISTDANVNGVNIGRGAGNIASNTRVGVNALNSNTTGSSNTANGISALSSNTTGFNNTANGRDALFSSTTGNNNTANGVNAGRFIADGVTPLMITNNSVFLGVNTRALDDNQTNQIVIGHNATGLGSNTVTLGNTSITTTRLRGAVLGGSFVRDGGGSSQFLKADGSVDSSTYALDNSVVKLTGDQTIGGLKTFSNILTGSIFQLQPNNTIGSTPNYIGQQMASNDNWKIYGNSIATDIGELVFEIGDNASPSASNGQRFRFNYDNSNSGIAKSPFILDYNQAIFDANASFSGNVVIGTTNPATRLFVVSTADTYVGGFQGAGGTNLIALGTVAGNVPAINGFTANFGTVANLVLQHSGGNVGIGTTSPSEKLHVSGNVLATGLFQSSDLRLKDIISRDGDVIKYKWKYKRDDKIHIGYVAQEVLEVMPDAVSEDSEGMLSVNYIEVLVAKIAKLENRIKQLEK